VIYIVLGFLGGWFSGRSERSTRSLLLHLQYVLGYYSGEVNHGWG
jgi:hypothetical protein